MNALPYRIFFISILLSLSYSGWSQEYNRPQRTQTVRKQFNVTTTLTDYIPSFQFNLGKFNLGLTHYTKHRWAFSGNIAYIHQYKPTRREGWLSPKLTGNGVKGFHVQGAMLFFENSTAPKAGFKSRYLGVQIEYQYTETQKPEYSNSINTGDFYQVDRHQIKTNLLFGWHHIEEKSIVYDINIGIGIKYITSNNSSINPDYEKYPYKEKEVFQDKFFDIGENIAFSLFLQYKIGGSW